MNINNLREEGIKMLKEDGYNMGDYNPHRRSAWLIQNDHIATVALGDHEQDAIDNVVDSGAWDSLMMSDEDLNEYQSEGWDDSYLTAGNASEAFWCENLNITKIVTA